MGNLLAAEMELRSVHASFTKLGVTLRDVLEGGSEALPAVQLGRRLRTTFGSAKGLADRWFPRRLAAILGCRALLDLVTITSPWMVWRCWSWSRMVPSRLVTLARCLG